MINAKIITAGEKNLLSNALAGYVISIENKPLTINILTSFAVNLNVNVIRITNTKNRGSFWP